MLNNHFSLSQENETPKIILSDELLEDQKIELENPYFRLLGDCLKSAIKNDASDIHIEPKENGLDIKIRRNGELEVWKRIERPHRDILISSSKSLFNLDLSVIGRPQDSRASFKSLNIDLRVNSLPTIYGEKIVLRILDQSRTFNISEIDFSKDTHSVLNSIITRKNGLALISGPTGSGKTTTLYSLINSIDTLKLNVSTLENPVEYRLPGINQIDVGSNRELTFSNGLRALMRQDPDVILIGEIRDHETADMAFKAASTGHLVFSTLHANGSKEVVERLLNLGIDEFTLKSNLIFSAAQRLLKKVCPHCSQELDDLSGYDIPKQEKNYFRKRNINGCKKCSKGVVGRVPILEYLDQRDIQDFLSNKGGIPSSFNSLSKIALDKASKGLVDLKESLEVA